MGKFSNSILDNKRLKEDNIKLLKASKESRNKIIELSEKLKESEQRFFVLSSTNYAMWFYFEKQLDILIATNEPITKVKEYLKELKEKQNEHKTSKSDITA